MNSQITSILISLFNKYRIVFWYDTKKELRPNFETVELPGVAKLEINNNEYALKHRILREEPTQKFLLYHEGPQPEDMQNWLLDVLLANVEFRTDQVTLWLSELGLGIEFAKVVQDHLEFFRATKRREGLKKLLKSTDTANNIQVKMLAICAGADARIDAVLESLLQDLADDKDEKFKLLERSGLDSFFWQQMGEMFNYETQTPSIQDFAIELFKSAYALALGQEGKLSADALVFLKRWKDDRKCKATFITLSEQYANVLRIENDLNKRDYRDVIDLDLFRIIDLKIISSLIHGILCRTISFFELYADIRQRRQSIWHEEFSHIYDAIECASALLDKYNTLVIEMDTISTGIDRYCQSWFQIDQLYRRFNYHSRMATQPTLMGKLVEQVENLYDNSFIPKLNNRFQELLTDLTSWRISSIQRQDEFFATYVQPFIRKDNRVCVIISDALRYEIGEELQQAIQREDKFTAELTPMLAMLPSYTQLGMAALLPHKVLDFAEDENATVLVDGQSSSGKENRTQILQEAVHGRGRAVLAEEILDLDKEETRELLKANDVLYIYHNRIDATGDKKESEDKVFEAAHETIAELVRLVKKLTGNNASNLIITTDHGFLFQRRSLVDSDFVDADFQSQQVTFKSRRFVLGHDLQETPGLNTFKAIQLGLAGDIEVQIPKSVNRMRIKGSGSRYVHGGASLQEIIIPVIKINKKRLSDTSLVDVEIISEPSSAITSGQLAITLYQRNAITDKIKPRTLRIGIFTEDGDLVSDSQELVFDQISENPRDREITVRLLLTSMADMANGKDVVLKLEERISGTNHYTEYTSRRYAMRRSFTTDFDF